jgi:hypothetical protein
VAPKGPCCYVYLVDLQYTRANVSKNDRSTPHVPTSGEKLPPPTGRDLASRCSGSVIDQTEVASATKSPRQAPRLGAVLNLVACKSSRSPLQLLHAAASGAPGPSSRTAHCRAVRGSRPIAAQCRAMRGSKPCSKPIIMAQCRAVRGSSCMAD